MAISVRSCGSIVPLGITMMIASPALFDDACADFIPMAIAHWYG